MEINFSMIKLEYLSWSAVLEYRSMGYLCR